MKEGHRKRLLIDSDWYVRRGPVSADRSISEALNGKPVAVLDATQDERVQYREQPRKRVLGWELMAGESVVPPQE